jgi:type II secretory pathway component PulF
LLRDFSTMLSVLLDADLPEPQAINLAAECTANHLITRRAETVTQQLERGVPLTDALAALDDGGEFRWRLANAAHGHGGFLRALAGWHEALEARAYQQEQAVSQLVTTSLVLLNGVFVALVAIGMFQMFTSVIERMVLW